MRYIEYLHLPAMQLTGTIPRMEHHDESCWLDSMKTSFLERYPQVVHNDQT